jgi:transcriptional regulator of met regulon
MGERVISDPAGYKARQLEKIDGLEHEKAVLDREIANTREQCEAHVKAYEGRKAAIDADIAERRNEVAACDEALAKVPC